MKKKTKRPLVLPVIYTIRRLKVVLDSDLARLYGVQPKRLNEAVQRNRARFPADFSFRLNREESINLKVQTSAGSECGEKVLRSQIATLKNDGRGRHRKYAPRVFTEHGALMAANILRSEKAVEMSLYLIRAFVQMRDALLTNTAILQRLAEIDGRLLEHDSVLREVVERLQPLLDAPEIDEQSKPKIGFHRGNR
jgi:phage regulator Rha-like protein